MLEKIVAKKREELQNFVLPEQRDVERASLIHSIKSSANPVSIIAEVKKASPSKGVIRPDFDPAWIAGRYEEGGARAVSVLTDRHFFQGDRSYLTEIKQKVSIPVLRKDFIISPEQVEESARIGADAILLIGEALEPAVLFELFKQAEEKGMEALVEVHSAETLEMILSVFQPPLIGINNRNLKTFHTDLSQTEKVAEMVPEGSMLVSESGIFSSADLERVHRAGAEAALIGESLMRKPDPGEAAAVLLGGVRVEPAAR
ncbi:indole-3-glycerol phosphate synthase TrpC [Bacillus marinisedimentorum]|uniref:indole-3-glycerol phosphate synthase TrpC n=1 Tax=Bacillus marinisedimentorum TaxID=1821260 RepID=UPI0007DFC952|nr:indole-3-glycerol phosphate synthase TrpC [Bacillus marinisedimentorum]